MRAEQSWILDVDPVEAPVRSAISARLDAAELKPDVDGVSVTWIDSDNLHAAVLGIHSRKLREPPPSLPVVAGAVQTPGLRISTLPALGVKVDRPRITWRDRSPDDEQAARQPLP